VKTKRQICRGSHFDPELTGLCPYPLDSRSNIGYVKSRRRGLAHQKTDLARVSQLYPQAMGICQRIGQEKTSHFTAAIGIGQKQKKKKGSFPIYENQKRDMQREPF
jgi:hypothetical protein